MKAITLSKIELSEIEVLQQEVEFFSRWKSNGLQVNKNPVTYFNNLLLVDVSQRLFYNFRSKVEKLTRTTVTLKLSVSEAVVLLECCLFTDSIRTEFETYTMQKISRLLHQELVNI